MAAAVPGGAVDSASTARTMTLARPSMAHETADNALVATLKELLKDQVKDVKLDVIGFAYKDGSNTSETARFESRIVEGTDEQARAAPAGARY